MANRKRVAILGGGIAGLSAAYELSETDEYEVTLYTMGWRLGGKGASSCNKALGNRVEEHGLHLWFGFYENAFDLMRKTYAAMDPPQSIEDHFTPVDEIVLGEEFNGRSVLREIHPPRIEGEPGVGDHAVDFWSVAETSLAWLLKLETERHDARVDPATACTRRRPRRRTAYSACPASSSAAVSARTECEETSRAACPRWRRRCRRALRPRTSTLRRTTCASASPRSSGTSAVTCAARSSSPTS